MSRSDDVQAADLIGPGDTANATARGSKDAAIDLRIAEARAKLGARLNELERRVDHVKHVVDPRGWLDDKPWARVGVAAALGFVLGRSEMMRPIIRSALGTVFTTLINQAVQRIEH